MNLDITIESLTLGREDIGSELMSDTLLFAVTVSGTQPNDKLKCVGHKRAVSIGFLLAADTIPYV